MGWYLGVFPDCFSGSDEKSVSLGAGGTRYSLCASLHVATESALVPQMRLVSRDVLHILAAASKILQPPHTHMLPSHGRMFTVCVCAVIDNDWDPGITKVTCLQRQVAQAWQKNAP